jgi:glycosyltransferase involved in cell wall biosynthesis
MTISLILPVFNGGRLLEEAVASVLAQDRAPDEFLLVDDGSTDGAAEAVARAHPGIRYLRQPNGGVASARNLGLVQATGDLVSFLDSDDLWPSDSLGKNLDCLKGDPSISIAMGKLQILKPGPSGTFEPTDYLRSTLHLGASLFRRQAFDRVGPFETALKRASDLDWFLRARHAGITTRFHDSITYLYRHHPNGLTGDSDAQRSSHVEAVRRALHRQRASSSPSQP